MSSSLPVSHAENTTRFRRRTIGKRRKSKTAVLGAVQWVQSLPCVRGGICVRRKEKYILWPHCADPPPAAPATHTAPVRCAETMRVVKVGGECLFYAWAIEQEEGSRSGAPRVPLPQPPTVSVMQPTGMGRRSDSCQRQAAGVGTSPIPYSSRWTGSSTRSRPMDSKRINQSLQSVRGGAAAKCPLSGNVPRCVQKGRAMLPSLQ